MGLKFFKENGKCLEMDMPASNESLPVFAGVFFPLFILIFCPFFTISLLAAEIYKTAMKEDAITNPITDYLNYALEYTIVKLGLLTPCETNFFIKAVYDSNCYEVSKIDFFYYAKAMYDSGHYEVAKSEHTDLDLAFKCFEQAMEQYEKAGEVALYVASESNETSQHTCSPADAPPHCLGVCYGVEEHHEDIPC
jgi:hypothetical protein